MQNKLSTIETFLKQNKRDFLNLISNKCKTPENALKKDIKNFLLKRLKKNISLKTSYLYSSENSKFFGWNSFRTDGCLSCTDEPKIIFEFKKITEGREYGYWHAMIQGLIYDFFERPKRPISDLDYPPHVVIVFIIDWGRACDRKLNTQEKEFLNKFKDERNIYTIRIRSGKNSSIEHNLSNNRWRIL